MKPIKLKCPETGCDREAVCSKFEFEETLVRAGGVLTNKPGVVERTFDGECPDHGPVWPTKDAGHHLTKQKIYLPEYEPVGYEFESESQVIAFAVRTPGRRFEPVHLRCG
jgi:hypothetical protein